MDNQLKELLESFEVLPKEAQQTLLWTTKNFNKVRFIMEMENDLAMIDAQLDQAITQGAYEKVVLLALKRTILLSKNNSCK